MPITHPHRAAFTRFAEQASRRAGQPSAFVLAVAVIAVWAISGPLFYYSDTWQLVINTSTTIITFMMVFLIQSSQNRDAMAIQIRLDELIRAVDGAHNGLLDLESLECAELEIIRGTYKKLAERAREAIKGGRGDTGVGEMEPE